MINNIKSDSLIVVERKKNILAAFSKINVFREGELENVLCRWELVLVGVSRGQEAMENEILKRNECFGSDLSYVHTTKLGNMLEEMNEGFLKKYPPFEGFVSSYIAMVSVRGDFKSLLLSSASALIPLMLQEADEDVNRMKYASFALRLFRHFDRFYTFYERKTQTPQLFLNLNDSQKFQVGSYLTYLLRILGVCEKEEEIGEFGKKNIYICVKDFELINEIPYLAIRNLPMVEKPKTWKEDSSDGGYFLEHTSPRTLFPHEPETSDIIYSNDRTHIKYTPQGVTVANHIQQTPFQVRSENLYKIINNLEAYLEEEKIEIHHYKNEKEYVKDKLLKNKPANMSVGFYSGFCHKEYKRQKCKVLKIGITLWLAALYEGVSFYFVLYTDFRGRVYRYGWPLNPQGNRLSKLLLEITHKEAKTVSLDASASGFSIYALLGGNNEVLKLTNILEGREEDFYTHLLRKLNSDIKDFSNLLYGDGSPMITRDVIKSILIPFIYNEGVRGTEKKLKKIQAIENAVQTMIPDRKHPFMALAHRIRKVVSSLVPEIAELKKLLKILIMVTPNKKGLVLQDNKMFKSSMFYPELKKTRIMMNATHGVKTHQIKTVKEPLNTDINKMVIAASPNLIHSLDALLLLETVSRLQAQNIPVSTTHDCFVVLECHETKVQEAYRDAVKELLTLNILNDLVALNPGTEASLAALPESFRKTQARQAKKLIDGQIAMKKRRNKVLEEGAFNSNPLKKEITKLSWLLVDGDQTLFLLALLALGLFLAFYSSPSYTLTQAYSEESPLKLRAIVWLTCSPYFHLYDQAQKDVVTVQAPTWAKYQHIAVAAIYKAHQDPTPQNLIFQITSYLREDTEKKNPLVTTWAQKVGGTAAPLKAYIDRFNSHRIDLEERYQVAQLETITLQVI